MKEDDFINLCREYLGEIADCDGNPEFTLDHIGASESNSEMARWFYEKGVNQSNELVKNEQYFAKIPVKILNELYLIALCKQMRRRGFAGQSFTTYVCLKCGEPHIYPNTNTPCFCKDCTDTLTDTLFINGVK